MATPAIDKTWQMLYELEDATSRELNSSTGLFTKMFARAPESPQHPVTLLHVLHANMMMGMLIPKFELDDGKFRFIGVSVVHHIQNSRSVVAGMTPRKTDVFHGIEGTIHAKDKVNVVKVNHGFFELHNKDTPAMPCPTMKAFLSVKETEDIPNLLSNMPSGNTVVLRNSIPIPPLFTSLFGSVEGVVTDVHELFIHCTQALSAFMDTTNDRVVRLEDFRPIFQFLFELCLLKEDKGHSALDPSLIPFLEEVEKKDKGVLERFQTLKENALKQIKAPQIDDGSGGSPPPPGEDLPETPGTNTTATTSPQTNNTTTIANNANTAAIGVWLAKTQAEQATTTSSIVTIMEQMTQQALMQNAIKAKRGFSKFPVEIQDMILKASTNKRNKVAPKAAPKDYADFLSLEKHQSHAFMSNLLSSDKSTLEVTRNMSETLFQGNLCPTRHLDFSFFSLFMCGQGGTEAGNDGSSPVNDNIEDEYRREQKLTSDKDVKIIATATLTTPKDISELLEYFKNGKTVYSLPFTSSSAVIQACDFWIYQIENNIKTYKAKAKSDPYFCIHLLLHFQHRVWRFLTNCKQTSNTTYIDYDLLDFNPIVTKILDNESIARDIPLVIKKMIAS
jgi:SepF-like predicted cell division protein (DUF552 family)